MKILFLSLIIIACDNPPPVEVPKDSDCGNGYVCIINAD